MRNVVVWMFAGMLWLPAQASALDFTSLAAHQHGHATLNVAADGQDLFIEFNAPAIDVFGIEQRVADPSAQQQLQQQLMQKAQWLKQLHWLSLPTSANCQATEVEVNSSVLPTQAPSLTANAHHHHAEQADTHVEDHADVVINVSLRCQQMPALTQLTLNFWAHDLHFDQIATQWILPSGQGADTLSKAKPTLKFQ